MRSSKIKPFWKTSRTVQHKQQSSTFASAKEPLYLLNKSGGELRYATSLDSREVCPRPDRGAGIQFLLPELIEKLRTINTSVLALYNSH